MKTRYCIIVLAILILISSFLIPQIIVWIIYYNFEIEEECVETFEENINFWKTGGWLMCSPVPSLEDRTSWKT